MQVFRHNTPTGNVAKEVQAMLNRPSKPFISPARGVRKTRKKALIYTLVWLTSLTAIITALAASGLIPKY